MNYLAHCYLSFEQDGLLVGNYLGDFVRNHEISSYPEEIRDGIILHRKIDSWTDEHQVFRKGTALLHKSMGKYAPVILDIYFDYLLTKNWNRFHIQEFEKFCENTYKTLYRHSHLMPEKIQERLSRMIAGRWLESYKNYEGLNRTYYYLAKRARFPNRIEEASVELLDLESQLEGVFLEFFPRLEDFVKREIIPAND